MLLLLFARSQYVEHGAACRPKTICWKNLQGVWRAFGELLLPGMQDQDSGRGAGFEDAEGQGQNVT
jgi:hypothetical protein